MSKVFITRLFPQSVVKLLKDSGFVVEMWGSEEPVDYNYMIQKSHDIDGLICTLSDKINENYFNSAVNLKIVSTMSVGYDHIDLAIAKTRNIKVGYTPGVLTDGTAELAVSLLLTVSRRLIEGAAAVKDGIWGAWKPFWLCGYGLSNSSVGVIGLGMIGKAIAKRLQPFGVKEFFACGSSNSRTGEEVQIEPNLSVRMVDLDTLLSKSDFVIVTCSLNEKTKNLMNASAFSKMKSNAILINISRGPVVDQDALLVALTDGQIAGAGLDVTVPEPLPVDNPLLKLTNCVILPHIGSATIETRTKIVVGHPYK